MEEAKRPTRGYTIALIKTVAELRNDNKFLLHDNHSKEFWGAVLCLCRLKVILFHKSIPTYYTTFYLNTLY